jgi:hypothetical protein
MHGSAPAVSGMQRKLFVVREMLALTRPCAISNPRPVVIPGTNTMTLGCMISRSAYIPPASCAASGQKGH